MNPQRELARLLTEFQRAAESGQPKTPEEVCAQHPELLPQLVELLRDVGHLEQVLQGGGGGASTQELRAGIRAGRFEVLKLHDGGGIGLVYHAKDTELHRLVALKCLQATVAFDSHFRSSFLQEAELTSKLEHPGIVPVYGIGQDREGRPYFAMRFIEGTALSRAIQTLHARPGDLVRDETQNAELRRLLRSFATVCETMAYAHARGVIHRDLKPGNIMLGPYGETLVVDWGLGKRVDSPDPELTVEIGYSPVNLAQTAPGDTIPGRSKGTPAFMSPEQAQGDWKNVGPHSDLFALGATLYAILTGKKPYDGPTSQAILEQAKLGRFPAPRRVRAEVPRALEAICLKAMAFEPGQRYPNAKELAADVQRWLDDQPVQAWREPFPLRARRWMKRHRTLVSTSLGIVAVGVIALAAFGVVLNQKNEQLREANVQLDAKAKQERADREAISALEEDADRVLQDQIEQAFAVAPLEEQDLARQQQFREMIQRIGEHYERALKTHPDPDRYLGGTAACRYWLLRTKLASYPLNPEVRREFADTEAMLRKAIARNPLQAMAVGTLATLLEDLGKLDRTKPDPESQARAFQRLNEARQLVQPLLVARPGLVVASAGIVVQMYDLNSKGKFVPPEEHLGWLREQLRLLEPMARKLHGQSGIEFGLLDIADQTLFTLKFQKAELEAKGNRDDQAKAIRELLQEMDRWFPNDPTGYRVPMIRAAIEMEFGRLQRQRGEWAAATLAFAQAHDRLSTLAGQVPLPLQPPPENGQPVLNRQTLGHKIRLELIRARLDLLHSAWNEVVVAGQNLTPVRRQILAKMALSVLNETERIDLFNPPNPKQTAQVMTNLQEAIPEWKATPEAFDRKWWDALQKK